MTARGGIPEDHGTDRGVASARPALALALAGLIALALPNPSRAQFFSDRPPPVPPSSIPDAPSGGAISLAPPSGPASTPNLPAPLTQPPVSAVTPPLAPPPIASTPGQAVLSLTARYGKDLPVINGGLVWRGFFSPPRQSGNLPSTPPGTGASLEHRTPPPPSPGCLPPSPAPPAASCPAPAQHTTDIH